MNEIKQQAEHEARMAAQLAEEKIRRAEAQAKLQKKRSELKQQQISAELQKTRSDLKALSVASSARSRHPLEDFDDEDEDRHVRNLREKAQSVCSSCHSDQAELIKTMVDSVNLGRLPVPEPVTFSGDHLAYPAWKSAFTALIESRKIPPLEIIYYLQKYLSGEARQVVEGLFLFSTEDNFEQTKKILDDRYANAFLVAEAFRDKLHDWPKINARNPQAFRQFADFARQCSVAMI